MQVRRREVRRLTWDWDHVGRRLGHVGWRHVRQINITMTMVTIGERRRSTDHGLHHGQVRRQLLTILHYLRLSLLSSLLLVSLILLLLPDLVSLVRLAPGVVSRRSTIDQVIQSSVPSVLTCPEHVEVGLERLQQLIHHVTARWSWSSTEWIVVTQETRSMETGSSSVSVSTVRPGVLVLQQVLVVRVDGSSSDCC